MDEPGVGSSPTHGGGVWQRVDATPNPILTPVSFVMTVIFENILFKFLIFFLVIKNNYELFFK